MSSPSPPVHCRVSSPSSPVHCCVNSPLPPAHCRVSSPMPPAHCRMSSPLAPLHLQRLFYSKHSLLHLLYSTPAQTQTISWKPNRPNRPRPMLMLTFSDFAWHPFTITMRCKWVLSLGNIISLAIKMAQLQLWRWLSRASIKTRPPWLGRSPT